MKILLSCGGMLVVASGAFAQVPEGLHMKWAGCPNNAAAVEAEDFLCDGTTHNLHGSFTISRPIAGAKAMDAILDLQFQSPAVPTFWQFQYGGCNEVGVFMSDARPTVNCTTAQQTNLFCLAGGTGCDAFITAYAFGSAINFPENRARLLMSLAMESHRFVNFPANLSTNQHFMFQLQFSETNAEEIGGACEGCMTGVAITWNQMILYNTEARTGGEGIALSLSSASPGSVDATVFSNCLDCQAVGTKNRRWGQLKAMYR